jgi:predicted nuclease with TOPRIM domain
MQEGTQKRSVAEVFKEKRETYSAEIYDGIKLLDNIKKMTNVQVIFLSLRQRLLEENHTLLEHFTRLKKTYREKKGEEWVETSKSMQLRFNSNEKTTIVDGKTAEIKERLEQIENQIAFYAESIKTVDAVLFGLKTRVDVEKLLG